MSWFQQAKNLKLLKSYVKSYERKLFCDVTGHMTYE